MSPAIFLDFDGPLRNLRVSTCGFDTDPVAVATLWQTLKDLQPQGARLVVSSSWRHAGREACLGVLDRWRGWKLSPFLATDWCISGPEWRAETPSNTDTRAANIMDWLRGNEGFAITRSLLVDDYHLGRFLPLAAFARADEVDGLDGPTLRKIVDWKLAMKRAEEGA